MDLGAFSDLPTALGFVPPSEPQINSAQLLSHLGKLPKFPTDFQIVRGENGITKVSPFARLVGMLDGDQGRRLIY